MIDFNKYTFSEKGTALQALQLINEIAIPNMAVFVLNENKQLVGSLTDGDIRRGLLKGLSIDKPVSSFMNPNRRVMERVMNQAMAIPNNSAVIAMETTNIRALE